MWKRAQTLTDYLDVVLTIVIIALLIYTVWTLTSLFSKVVNEAVKLSKPFVIVMTNNTISVTRA